MHVDHLHRKIFHAEHWEFRPLCDKKSYANFNFAFLYHRHTKYKRVYSFRLFRNNVCLCVLLFFFIKDFSGTTAPRILKSGINIGYDLLYHVRENQRPHSYHSLYLSIFSFSPIKFFIKEFAGTTACKILKFCRKIGYDLLYCVRENQHPHAFHSLYLSISIFLFLQSNFSSQISQLL